MNLNNITTLPLTNTCNFAIINIEDYDRCKLFKWYIKENRKIVSTCVDQKVLHQFILDAKNVDHKNRDIFYNNRDNLREATKAQNAWNVPKRRKNTTSYAKGVNFNKLERRWKARISVNGEIINLGTFKTEAEAVIARNTAVKKYHGEFGLIYKLR